MLLVPDYYSCMDCGVIVNSSNSLEHTKHDILGEMFVIKNHKKKLDAGLISKSVINAARELIAEGRWEKKLILEKKQKRLAQERFSQQIPNGDVIVNLLEMKLNG